MEELSFLCKETNKSFHLELSEKASTCCACRHSKNSLAVAQESSQRTSNHHTHSARLSVFVW